MNEASFLQKRIQMPNSTTGKASKGTVKVVAKSTKFLFVKNSKSLSGFLDD